MKKLLLASSWQNFARYIQKFGLVYFPLAWCIGLYWTLAIAPVDAVQGEIYRMIYLHVPAAFMSLGIYVAISILGVIYLTWRIKFCDLVCRAVAPVGMLMCMIALVTGALWGKPTWGTYWIWDARLTSELVLFIFYLMFCLLTTGSHQQQKVLAYALLLLGLIDVPIVHYAVNWWHTLHQGSTVFAGHQAIDVQMARPLYFMIFNFMVICVVIGSFRFTQLLKRRGA